MPAWQFRQTELESVAIKRGLPGAAPTMEAVFDIGAPLIELCIVWQPSHSATPPEWNANTKLLVNSGVMEAKIIMRHTLSIISIRLSIFTLVCVKHLKILPSSCTVVLYTVFKKLKSSDSPSGVIFSDISRVLVLRKVGTLYHEIASKAKETVNHLNPLC